MKRVACLLPLALAAALVGCQEEGPAPASVAPVSGAVTLDGKPMEGGEVRFLISGQAPQVLEIQNGAFAGEAYVGQNQVHVLWEKDGPPNPMNPETPLKVNLVSPKFSGPSSPFQVDVPAAGATDLKFAVTK